MLVQYLGVGNSLLLLVLSILFGLFLICWGEIVMGCEVDFVSVQQIDKLVLVEVVVYDDGLVCIEFGYWVVFEECDIFLGVVYVVGQVCCCNGVWNWCLYCDLEEVDYYIECFIVELWLDYLCQCE